MSNNTISNFIKSQATIYSADTSNPKEPKLTQKDFLADLALSRRCGDDFTTRTIPCHQGYHKNEDAFIDDVLGKPETLSRNCYEVLAQRLYRLALRFIDSTDEVAYDHPYLKETRKIETETHTCNR